MAKTFEDINGNIIEIEKYETSLELNEDIITGKVSGYFVIVKDYKYEVSRPVYEAVENYIG